MSERNVKQAGFTLIEVLVVVSILGVLMGLVSILVLRASDKQKKSQTELLVRSYLPNAIERYLLEFKRLPPMTLKELNDSSSRFKDLNLSDNSVNECIEVLAVALRHPDLSAPLAEDDLGIEKPFVNTDDDVWNQIPEGSGRVEAMEIADSWGNPIVYISKNAYGKPVTIRNHKGEDVTVEARKRANGDYYNPTKYQIICLGDNGVQDIDDSTGGDDIMNFKLEEE